MKDTNTPQNLDFVNLDDIDEGSRVPDGEYIGKIVDAEVRENKLKDGMYISYSVIVQEGDYAGRRVFSIWSLKKEALWRMKKDFKNMNYKPVDGRPQLGDIIGFEGSFRLVTTPDKKDAERTNQNLNWLAPLL